MQNMFQEEHEMNQHFRTHTGNSLFECSEFSQGFAYRPNLYRHMRKHTGERPYKCDLCPRTYAHIAGLRIHKRCHSGEKFECDICLNFQTRVI